MKDSTDKMIQDQVHCLNLMSYRGSGIDVVSGLDYLDFIKRKTQIYYPKKISENEYQFIHPEDLLNETIKKLNKLVNHTSNPRLVSEHDGDSCTYYLRLYDGAHKKDIYLDNSMNLNSDCHNFLRGIVNDDIEDRIIKKIYEGLIDA